MLDGIEKVESERKKTKDDAGLLTFCPLAAFSCLQVAFGRHKLTFRSHFPRFLLTLTVAFAPQSAPSVSPKK